MSLTVWGDCIIWKPIGVVSLRLFSPRPSRYRFPISRVAAESPHPHCSRCAMGSSLIRSNCTSVVSDRLRVFGNGGGRAFKPYSPDATSGRFLRYGYLALSILVSCEVVTCDILQIFIRSRSSAKMAHPRRADPSGISPNALHRNGAIIITPSKQLKIRPCRCMHSFAPARYTGKRTPSLDVYKPRDILQDRIPPSPSRNPPHS